MTCCGRLQPGKQFFDQYWDVYYRLSPRVVEAMNSDPEIKELVRWSIVAPLVRYYELVLAFPDTPPETVAEPWRSFLFKVRDEMEGWASVIELPRTLGKADLISAAREIGVALRYLLRSESKRADYLGDLDRRGEIPLRGSSEELRAAESELQRYERPTQEIERILGLKPGKKHCWAADSQRV
jgi:hypothetical protein